MTAEQKTELEYLIDLLREASKWNVDQGDDALRLEVDLRINNILNSVEVEGETEVQGEPEVSPVLTQDDYKALEAAKLNEHLDNARSRSRSRWESGKVRCSENGRLVWRPRSECQKVPRDTTKGGPKWKWQWMGPQDKKAQEEEMWAAHEKGEE